ncbi:MAG: hypothetical protein HY335_02655 [Deinococcus sp.]|nr:hypothetical protein [Deinococcus sp.]
MAKVDLEQVVQSAKQQVKRASRVREGELGQLHAQNAQLKHQLADMERDLVAAKNHNCLLVERLAALEDELARRQAAPASPPQAGRARFLRWWRRL